MIVIVIVIVISAVDVVGLPVPARKQNHPPRPQARQRVPERRAGDQDWRLWPGHPGTETLS